jgi:hypothetical protein
MSCHNYNTHHFASLFSGLDIHVTVHRDKFLIIKPTRGTNFSNLFWNKTPYVSDSTTLILLASCQQTCMTYTIAEKKKKKLLMMERGTVRNM